MSLWPLEQDLDGSMSFGFLSFGGGHDFDRKRARQQQEEDSPTKREEPARNVDYKAKAFVC